MPQAKCLTQAQVTEALIRLPLWQYHDHRLIRTHPCPTYPAALALVQAIGLLAEAMDHHPDLHLHYKTLTIHYWTHTAGGVTQQDVEAAVAVEGLIREQEG